MTVSAPAPTVHANDDERERERLARAFTEVPGFGDLVSCRFPLNERPNLPGPKRRPCCVIGASRQNGQLYISVAYCTGARVDDARDDELTITDPDTLSRAGLHRPTRIVVSRARLLPFSYTYFTPNQDGTVLLGRLTEFCRAHVAQLVRALASDHQNLKRRRAVPRDARRRRPAASRPSPALSPNGCREP